MNEEMIAYVMLGVIISVIVNVLFIKIKNLIDIFIEHNRMENEPIPDERPYHVPDITPSRVPPAIPTRTSPTSHVNLQRTNSRITRRPPLPRGRSGEQRTPDTFPKCPRCGCRNRRGQTQFISWDERNNKWRCYNGHLFSS